LTSSNGFSMPKSHPCRGRKLFASFPVLVHYFRKDAGEAPVAPRPSPLPTLAPPRTRAPTDEESPGNTRPNKRSRLTQEVGPVALRDMYRAAKSPVTSPRKFMGPRVDGGVPHPEDSLTASLLLSLSGTS
jgi:hypothetical protein